MADTSSYTRPENASYASGAGGELAPSQDLIQYCKDYAREKPEVAALWVFGIGFILGWKLKPW